MQRSKMVDDLCFLCLKEYNGYDMSTFNVMLEYVLPVSRSYKTEILTLQEDLYTLNEVDYLQYKLPFDTALTSEAGDIEIQLTFSRVDVDEEGNNIQYVRKTTATTIKIIPITAWSDIIPDEALTALDAKMVELDGKIREIEAASGVYLSSKADNMVLDTENKTLHLTAQGEPIGDEINLNDLGDALADNTTEGLVNVII